MLALKQYELSNHLGNVLATVLDRRTMTSDKVLAYATNFTGTLDGWTAGWSAAGTLYNVTPPTTVSIDNNRLQCTATTSMGGVRNVINTSVGVSYTLTLDIDMGTAEGLYIMPRTTNGSNIYTGTNLAQVYVTSSGTYSVNFTASTTTTQLLVEKAGSVAQTFYIDNVKVEQSTPTLNSYPIADVVNAQYYYPFGSPMKTWKADGDDYRFGFNGQEKDDEVSGSGNIYTAEYWEYDSRLGRRWNVDPIVKYNESPYAVLGNNPIWFIDHNGADTSFADAQAKSDFNATYSDVNKAIQNMQEQLDAIKQDAKNHSWSNKKLARKSAKLTARLDDLNKIKTAFDEIIKSPIKFIYSTDQSTLQNADGTTSQTGESEVTIKFKPGMQGTIIHESRHGYGFILKEWNNYDGYDWEDERQGFLYQMIWDANAVQTKIEIAARNKYPDDPDRQATYTLTDMIRDNYNKVDYKEFKQYYVK